MNQVLVTRALESQAAKIQSSPQPHASSVTLTHCLKCLDFLSVKWHNSSTYLFHKVIVRVK